MDELFTLKDAAAFLQVSDKTLMRLLQEENIPARKLGKEWRFSKNALIEWIARGDSKVYAKNTVEIEDEI